MRKITCSEWLLPSCLIFIVEKRISITMTFYAFLKVKNIFNKKFYSLNRIKKVSHRKNKYFIIIFMAQTNLEKAKKKRKY